MKRLTLISLTVLTLLSVVLAACQPKESKIRVASDATFPPFELVDEQTKELTGYDIEMMKALSEKTGLQFEYTNIAFDPVLAGISSCQYDLAVSAITITDERKQTMLFSDPYIKAGQIVSVLKTNTEIKSKDDLKGKNIGAQLGTTGEIEAKKIEGANIKSYDSVDLAFLDLKNGQVDAVITDYPTALGFIGQNADIMQTVGEVFTDESYGIAVCKNKTDLLNKVNEGLAALKSDGTLEKLEKKWVQGVK